ncbi:hypothetical protein ACFWP2_38010 [Kitasatospora sp. NPDC058444]|uniref:hypothetical protein n=1 Tax=Kitasatospora sp. NPDC058444 TaxID=3346504 RepID=UPI003664FA91
MPAYAPMLDHLLTVLIVVVLAVVRWGTARPACSSNWLAPAREVLILGLRLATAVEREAR